MSPLKARSKSRLRIREPSAAWYTLALVNAEMMKNVAEIGAIKRLYRATQGTRG